MRTEGVASILSKFQFHKGTIKTCAFPQSCYREIHFNSIKVRLKLLLGDDLAGLVLFQFHKGTIKTFTPSAPL